MGRNQVTTQPYCKGCRARVTNGITLKRRTLVPKSEDKGQKGRTPPKSQNNKKKNVCGV